MLSDVRRSGFSLLDLLVVIGIISLLISLLLPALANVREQSRYVRWQAYSRDMSMDPNMAVYYTFQNDRGNNTITNMAVANHDPSYLPNLMNLGFSDATTGNTVASNSAMANYFWSANGRFAGKPAGTFINSGPGNNLLLTPTTPEGSGMLARLLRNSQAITIAVWLYVPPTAVGQESSLCYWTDPQGERIFNINLPWDDSVNWQTYGWPNYNSLQVPFVYGQDSNWSLWCFTKDNNTGLQKIYLNGQIVNATGGTVTPSTAWHSFYTGSTLPITNHAASNFTFGRSLTYGSINATIDEFAIFDADLSPNDVTPSGNIIPGVPASRFLQMYQMGLN